jgi:3-methyladenine DNA glycosylase/8-oxoguanine DNA glycosylase
MEKIARNWRPYRTIAARIFWIHEDGLRREKREADARAKAEKAASAKMKKEKA